ncbi:hypothetical protein K7395_11605 [Streptomyces filamentosus]|uniref:AG2 protein n=1 Tax=Streptomyces filamentosus TaxID=67294 RepID=A0ABY4UVC6_STRFL|nr:MULTISPECIES: DUF6571 family protein [Streptomyces]MYR81168.1 hypothetical protein [Streptomyces sp. SID5466]USC47345.1 hypothetical protein K7395_11605 [Streptomyces filamentosus]
MPTYYEVMQTDLSKLTAAADEWEAMAGKFKKLEDQYKKDVHGVTVDGSWVGLSATAANEHFKVTLRELQAAQTEAKAIAALVRDAYSQFVDLRGKVQAARAGAIEAGMKVSAQGAVFFDTEKLSPSNRNAYQHDPSYQESGRAEAAKWEQAIDRAVKAVTDADAGVKIALNAVVVDTDVLDGTMNGFNAKAKSDIEKYEADRMTEISTRINSGTATAQDLKEAERSLRDNSGNKVYSQTLLNSLGPDGTIKFTNKLNDLAYHEDKKGRNSYLAIQAGLANTLATATAVPELRDKNGKTAKIGSPGYDTALEEWKKSKDGRFYSTWMEDIRSNGTKEFDLTATQAHRSSGIDQKALGYQSLVTLMQHGDASYSGAFLHDLADSIRAAEDPNHEKAPGNPNIWDLDHKFDSKNAGKTDGWFANDPLDGLLGVMSKNPEASTAYFDPSSSSGKDNLEYFQTKRDWEVVNEYGTSRKDGVAVLAGDALDSDSHVGFGAALEAAATGRTPGSSAPEGFTEHTAAQTRVLEEVVRSYSEITKIDQGAMPENIRVNMANTLAHYPGDVHDILSGGVDYSDPDFSTHPNDVSVKTEEMNRFVRALSEDGGAFRMLHDSQLGHIAEQIDTLEKDDFTQKPTGNSDAAIGIARDSGKVMGTLDEIRADTLGDKRDSEIGQNNWNKVYKYHVYGAPITGLPVIGDSLQRLVDIGTGMQAETLNNAITNGTKAELIEHYEKHGYPRLTNMLNERAKTVHAPPEEISDSKGRMGDIRASAGSSYSQGIGSAQGSTGENG